MPLTAIISAIGMVGSNLPAFKSLFDNVLAMFDEMDQEVLKSAYADMMAKSDAAHRAAQEL